MGANAHRDVLSVAGCDTTDVRVAEKRFGRQEKDCQVLGFRLPLAGQDSGG
jgi:hypothetical protein